MPHRPFLWLLIVDNFIEVQSTNKMAQIPSGWHLCNLSACPRLYEIEFEQIGSVWHLCTLCITQ